MLTDIWCGLGDSFTQIPAYRRNMIMPTSSPHFFHKSSRCSPRTNRLKVLVLALFLEFRAAKSELIDVRCCPWPAHHPACISAFSFAHGVPSQDFCNGCRDTCLFFFMCHATVLPPPVQIGLSDTFSHKTYARALATCTLLPPLLSVMHVRGAMDILVFRKFEALGISSLTPCLV